VAQMIGYIIAAGFAVLLIVCVILKLQESKKNR